ncbi:restriction endonuclease subunit S [Pseudoteredinibacter isoporae]|uniref:restriction endonuclease subunit S n=1 Tax=Pseudoteredinibacter isoporae TaxID=570281 RepID=UPI00310B490E
MGAKYQPYPEYKDSAVEVIGDVPKSWVVGRLKQIVDQNRQITYGIVQAGPNKKGGIPYIRPADMTDEGGVKDYDGLLRTSPEIAADYERSKIKPGDIVCSIGPSFGKLMITPETLDGANLTQGTARVAISSAYNARYFFWALRATSSFQQWESSVGGATFRALNLGPLADTFVVVPSNTEQEKIANFLDHETAKIDTLIEKQQQLIKLLKEKRQAVISHAVTKGLNPNAPMRDSGVEWLGEVPEHWDVCRVKQITNFITSGPRGWSDYLSENGENIFLQSGDLNNKLGLELSGAKKVSPPNNAEGVRTKLENGDVVVCITGANTGRVAITPELDGTVYINQHLSLIRPIKSLMDSDYLGLVLSSSSVKSYFSVTQYGLKEGLSLSNVGEAPTCRPLLAEQKEIVQYAKNASDKYDDLESCAERQVVLLRERRTALISAAVTGKIDVRNWQAPEPSDNQNKEVAI